MVKVMFVNSLAPEKLKARLDGSKVPANCRFLAVISCNKPIWAKADSKRYNDLSIQKIQGALLKSQVRLLQLADNLVQAQQNKGGQILVDPQQLLTLTKDSLCLAGYANQQLNQ